MLPKISNQYTTFVHDGLTRNCSTSESGLANIGFDPPPLNAARRLPIRALTHQGYIRDLVAIVDDRTISRQGERRGTATPALDTPDKCAHSLEVPLGWTHADEGGLRARCRRQNLRLRSVAGADRGRAARAPRQSHRRPEQRRSGWRRSRDLVSVHPQQPGGSHHRGGPPSMGGPLWRGP